MKNEVTLKDSKMKLKLLSGNADNSVSLSQALPKHQGKLLNIVRLKIIPEQIL